ncbi:MAG TPA: SoxR reducing system RseC family protein [bacterium]|nr:SoxR reducing system RseC family protein [bacterium]
MKENGKVIELKGDIAVVKMERKNKCEKCGLCEKIAGRDPFIEVKNKIDAKIGDEVEVEIKEDDLLKISIFIFGFPLLGFILGIISSYFCKNITLKIVVFLVFLLSFWIAGFKKGKNYAENTKPHIVSKI